MLRVCVGLRSGVCMLFREFLLQNDFQVPLAWGEGGDFETMGVRGLAQHNLNFRFLFAKGLLSYVKFMFHVFIRSALDVLETRNFHFNNFKENK